jgi:hypothetical protein
MKVQIPHSYGFGRATPEHAGACPYRVECRITRALRSYMVACHGRDAHITILLAESSIQSASKECYVGPGTSHYDIRDREFENSARGREC